MTNNDLYSTQRRAGVFLDRDGVLIKNIDNDYVRSVDQIEILHGAKEAVKKLYSANLPLIIVTNQAAVAKGFITDEKAWDIQYEVESQVKGNNDIDIHSIICPHSDLNRCECRKPKPGMLLEGARRYQLDLSNSYFIGDALTDIYAARAANVKPIFVLTGRGESEYAKTRHEDLSDVIICRTVMEAARCIVYERRNAKYA